MENAFGVNSTVIGLNSTGIELQPLSSQTNTEPFSQTGQCRQYQGTNKQVRTNTALIFILSLAFSNNIHVPVLPCVYKYSLSTIYLEPHQIGK